MVAWSLNPLLLQYTVGCEQSWQACGVKGFLWACKLGFLGPAYVKLYQSFTRFSDWLILNDA